MADRAEEVFRTDGYKALLQRADASQILTDLWLYDRSLHGCRNRKLVNRKGDAGLEAETNVKNNEHGALARGHQQPNQGQRRLAVRPNQQVHHPGASGQSSDSQRGRSDNSGEATTAFSSEVPATAADTSPTPSRGCDGTASTPQPSGAHRDPAVSGAARSNIDDSKSNAQACAGDARPRAHTNRTAATQIAGHSAQLPSSPPNAAETVSRTNTSADGIAASAATTPGSGTRPCPQATASASASAGLPSGEHALHLERSTKRPRTSA